MMNIEAFTGDHVYLDANVFIYAVEGFAKYAHVCRSIFQSVEDMKLHAVTSELTLAEVLVLPIRQGDVRATAASDGLLRDQFDLTIAPVSRDVLRGAAELRATSNLKPDAIHVATAQRYNSQFIFTADTNLRAPDPLKIVTLDELLDA